MDTIFEPQLAIPVIVVVVGAVLVYIFGFKQTEEPSHEHLAVLQSSSSYKNRSISSNVPKTKSSPPTGNGVAGKTKVNGHLPNGTVNKKQQNKENKPPVVTTAAAGVGKIQAKKNANKDPANKPEDFESGEWIPAVSRKDKNKKIVKKVVVIPEEETEKVVAPAASPRKKEPVAVATPPLTNSPGKAPKIEDLLAEMKAGKPMVVVVDEVKEINKEEPVKDFKTNIAFDEMGGGDAWEEAKSRGAKKRRTRKD